MTSMVLLVPVLVLAAAPPEARLFSVGPQSSVTYTLVHKLHEVKGTCRHIEGKGRVGPDGSVQVQLRTRVDCYDSGNGNRDAHMKEVTEESRFPYVEIKGAAPPGTVPANATGAVQVPLEGKIVFHGVEQPFKAVFQAAFNSPTHASVTGSFVISLESFHIERPQLMFVKVDDALTLQPAFDLTQDPPRG